MVDIPFRIYPKQYNGSNPKKLERQRELYDAAEQIEHYINSKMAGQEKGMITYAEISFSLGIHVETVRVLLRPIGQGHGGITLYNPNYQPASPSEEEH